MNAIRTFALAGALALSAGLAGAGTASATPALGAEFAPQVTTSDANIVQAGHFGHHYGHNRLCRMPFFRLVRMFGYHSAKRIKFRCHRLHGHYGY